MTLKRLLSFLLIVVLLVVLYFFVVLNWSYSTGERAGWIQKLSNKGWVCKTWEGELALVSLPGTSTVEKFHFTVRDEAVAAALGIQGSRGTTLVLLAGVVVYALLARWLPDGQFLHDRWCRTRLVTWRPAPKRRA